MKGAIAYTNGLKESFPSLPVLLLTDVGVFVPPGTLSRSIETGYPHALMREISYMLNGEADIKELDITSTGLSYE